MTKNPPEVETKNLPADPRLKLKKEDRGALVIFEENITEARLDELEQQYKGLTCEYGQKKEIKAVSDAIRSLSTIRTAVLTRRRDLKNQVHNASEYIIARVEAIELPLKVQKDAVNAEEKRIKEEKAAKEKARVDAINEKIKAITDLGLPKLSDSVDDIEERIAKVSFIEITEDDYEEFTHLAVAERTKALASLDNALSFAKQREEQAAMMEKLRKEKEELEKKAEQARKAAEAEAKAKAASIAEKVAGDLVASSMAMPGSFDDFVAGEPVLINQEAPASSDANAQRSKAIAFHLREAYNHLTQARAAIANMMSDDPDRGYTSNDLDELDGMISTLEDFL